MIDKKLLDWDYYLDKIPLYLRNSVGIKDHFKAIYRLLVAMDEKEDDILNFFNLLDEDYLNKYVYPYDDNNKENFILLDWIGDIFGIKRELRVYVEDNWHYLKLKDNELYIFIKARILQNNFLGTFENSRSFYKNMDIPLYIVKGDLSAEASVYWNISEMIPSKNMEYLFKSGLLTLESMGITYKYLIVDVEKLAFWDSKEPSKYWDTGLWN